MTPIISKGNRIFTPKEYALLRFELTPVYQVLCDSMLHTRMHYEELWKFLEHPYQYSAASKIINNGRVIHLSKDGCNAVEVLKIINLSKTTELHLQTIIAASAKLAKISTEGIKSQTFRNTGIAWLLALYPSNAAAIAMQSGYKATQNLRENGLEVKFSEQDIADITMFFNGWVAK